MAKVENRWLKKDGKLHLDGWPVRIEKAPQKGTWHFMVFVEDRAPLGFMTLDLAKSEGVKYAEELAEFID